MEPFSDPKLLNYLHDFGVKLLFPYLQYTVRLMYIDELRKDVNAYIYRRLMDYSLGRIYV